MKYYLSFALFFAAFVTHAQSIGGCTDPQATNYNANASFNDGSCIYSDNTIGNIESYQLPNQLKETSGLAYFNNLLYTHNDDTQERLYVIDTIQGALVDSIEIDFVNNVDWEDIHVENNIFYVGDFGNNVSGNRTNLRIFKWHANDHVSGDFNIDTIKFSYQNQTDFTAQASNTTAFDCEAFIVIEDSIYLFTKRWNDSRSFLYVLPNIAGTHIAQLRDSLSVNGLVTGASYDAQRKHVVLCGYSTLLQPFVYMLYDYPQNDFFKGNKRKINLDLLLHQVEGITHDGNLNYYLSNEYTQVSVFPAQPAKLHKISLAPFFTNPIPNQPSTGLNEMEKSTIAIYPNPSSDLIYFSDAINGFKLIDLNGRVLMEEVGVLNSLDLRALRNGIYYLLIKGETKPFTIVKN